MLSLRRAGSCFLILALGSASVSSRALAESTSPPATDAPQVEITAPKPSNTSTSSKKNVPLGPTEKEVSMGDKATAQIEKNPKIKLLDPEKDEETKALFAKLNGMAEQLGKISARPLIKYKVKVIDEDEINAFTLPNGNIYFFKGLLNILGSDDEIAAVLAHEIAHNSCMHAMRGDKQARKLSWIGLAAILAAMAGGPSAADVGNFSRYLLVGIMSGYSVEFEKEADSAAVEMLRQTTYNPSALATVMQRFEAEEKRRPKIELGIFQTHPASPERAEAIETQIHKAGLEFNPRAVSGTPAAVVQEEKDRVLVKFKTTTLMEFSPENDGKARANRAAWALNDLFRDNLKMHEIQTAEIKTGGAQLTGRGIEIARVLPVDAKLHNLSPLACAQKWRENLSRLFWRERIHGGI